MSEDKKRTIKIDKAKLRIGRFWSAFVIFTAIAVVCCLVWKMSLWNSRSVNARLAAIEASLAIPESENAGVAYRKLAEDHSPLPDYPTGVDRQTLSLTHEKLWSSTGYPKLAAWLDERQDLISKLLDISRIEKCRFPIISDRQQKSYVANPDRDPIQQMGRWASLLVQSANMDTAEGRIDAAIEKYACVLQMGTHLRQQPILSRYKIGVAKELQALIRMKELITQTELTERQLAAIEAALLPAENKWKQHSRIMVKVQRLFEQRQFELRRRPRITEWRRYWEYWIATSKSDNRLLDEIHEYHLYSLIDRRKTYILIALRRFKNKAGHWPRSLDRIEPQLSKETLTDPRSNTPFVYEPAGENFRLHSKEAD